MNGAASHSQAEVSAGPGAPRAIVLAIAVAATFYLVAGVFEETLIRVIRPTELELDWISDLVLSGALGIAVYLWLHLRATRLALTERERSQLVLQTQLSMAEAMQRRLLPEVPAAAHGLEWAAVLKPAGKIGGDFFDFLEPRPGVRLMLIADVSGKGIPAAMALTLLRSTFRTVARATDDPAQLAARLSAAFFDEWHGSPYVTAIIARIDTATGTLTYTNAGHPRGLLIREGQDRGLAEGGPPLGLLRDARFVEASVPLVAGDIGVFVTDGISESFDETLTQWGPAVAQSAINARPRSADGICAAIIARGAIGNGPHGVEDWTDDRTVVVMTIGDAKGHSG